MLRNTLRPGARPGEGGTAALGGIGPVGKGRGDVADEARMTRRPVDCPRLGAGAPLPLISGAIPPTGTRGAIRPTGRVDA
jgi:hypothetical protein